MEKLISIQDKNRHGSLRKRALDSVRSLFTFPVLENFLVSRMAGNPRKWKKLIPPCYLYPSPSLRVAERNDVLFTLDISKLLEHHLYFYLDPDPGLDNVYRMIRPGFTVVDAGAHIGHVSIRFAQYAKRGFVHAFEPDAHSFQRLKENVLLNDFENIRIYPQALGAFAGNKSLYRIDPFNPGMNRILEQDPQVFYGREEVEVITLDQWHEQNRIHKIDLLKIDTEGYELHILEGGKNMIQRCKPILYLELIDLNLQQHGYDHRKVLHWLNEKGYSVLEATSMKPLIPRDSLYADVICLPHP